MAKTLRDAKTKLSVVIESKSSYSIYDDVTY